MLLRHLLAILLLPFTVVVVIPYWLLTSSAGASDTRWRNVSPLEWFPLSLGAVLLVCGLGLFSWCVSLFARVGRGTLAPWDPTQQLVAVGPYRYVRNPMISGVVMMLFGQALFFGSWLIGIWAALVLLVNQIYFLLLEEPGLEQRFGASYLAYKARVPRWIPRR